MKTTGKVTQKPNQRQPAMLVRAAPPDVPHRARTTEGLRDMLFDEIELLRQGKIDTNRLAVIGRASYQIIAAARLELEFAKLRADLLDATDTQVEAVQLGHEIEPTSDGKPN